VSPSGMVETPRLQAKHVCHSEAEPKNLNALTETLRGACPEILHGVYPEILRPVEYQPRP